MTNLFLQGSLIGLAIAAPVGPVGVLCIQRTLRHGFKMGFCTGLGASFADGVFGLIAGLGLTSISSVLVAHEFWIRAIGGIFLLYLAMKLFFSPPVMPTHTDSERSYAHAFYTTFFFTFMNPMTILAFLAIFAGVGVGTEETHYSEALTMVAGIILGAAFWWLLLNGTIAFISHKYISPKILHFIHYFSGAILFCFGLVAFFA